MLDNKRPRLSLGSTCWSIRGWSIRYFRRSHWLVRRQGLRVQDSNLNLFPESQGIPQTCFKVFVNELIAL